VDIFADLLSEPVTARGSRAGRQHAVDVQRHNRQVHVRRQQAQRHHEGVVENHFLRVAKIDAALNSVMQQTFGHLRLNFQSGARNPQLGELLGRRAAAGVGNAQTKHWRIVVKKVGDVIAGQYQETVGGSFGQSTFQMTKRGVELALNVD
jgi:hypothetical protein